MHPNMTPAEVRDGLAGVLRSHLLVCVSECAASRRCGSPSEVRAEFICGLCVSVCVRVHVLV
jgi:hypothetical protein